MMSLLEDTKEVNNIWYTMTKYFGFIIPFVQEIDPTILQKVVLQYDKFFEDQKLTYIIFFLSLESVKDVFILPYLKKALKF